MSELEPGPSRTETVLLAGIDKGNTDRAKLLGFVKGYEGVGLSKKIKWDDKGELSDLAVYGYKVEGGKITGGTPISGA